jgi:hypothetical protein
MRVRSVVVLVGDFCHSNLGPSALIWRTFPDAWSVLLQIYRSSLPKAYRFVIQCVCVESRAVPLLPRQWIARNPPDATKHLGEYGERMSPMALGERPAFA